MRKNNIDCFLISKKVGMSQFFLKNGTVIPVTILLVRRNKVLHLKLNKSRFCLTLVSSYKKDKSYRMNFNKTYKTKNFIIDFNKNIKKKKYISINSLEVGQHIDLFGISKGKGYSGVMKRHNFQGLEATHGVSISHRSGGSTGQCQDPGKVFKGKKMAGNMGNIKVTKHNILIVDIDLNLNLLVLKGSLPGFNNNYIYIKNSSHII